MKAFVRCVASGHEYPLCALSTDEFDDLIKSSRTEVCGVPVYYDQANCSRIWPIPATEFTMTYIIETPVLLKDILSDLGAGK